MLSGVYLGKKKDGTVYYRSSITHHAKHISLGSYPTERFAHNAYLEANKILSTPSYTLASYSDASYLPFSKWVLLCNFRDHGMYIKTPIYLRNKYFQYYFGPEDYLVFDVDDLFYYSTHSIMRRGGHYFVSDYGMQVNILNRYGIKNYGVIGRDYDFANGLTNDYRYQNIEIHNRYHGVNQKYIHGKMIYETKINVNGYYIVGRYKTEMEAAVAYNKAASLLITRGIQKEFPVNYIEELSRDEYRKLYQSVTLRKKITAFPQSKEPYKKLQ